MSYECIIITQSDDVVQKNLPIRPTLNEVLIVDKIAYQIDKILNDNGKRLWLICYPLPDFPFDTEQIYKEITSDDTMDEQ